MKVDGSLKSLLQGISQQPIRDRLAGQCTEQINLSSDPVVGLTRRPPTDLVGTFGPRRECLWNDFETRDGIRWLAQYNFDGSVNIRDLNNQPAIVENYAADYLLNFTDLAFASILADAYILNKDRQVFMQNEVYPYWNTAVTAGIIQILGNQYGRELRISINGIHIATYRPRNGSEENDALDLNTTKAAAQLVRALRNPINETGNNGYLVWGTGALANDTIWGIQIVEDVILIVNHQNIPFTLTTSDGFNNVNMKSMNNQVKNVADLPRFAPASYYVRVATKSDPEQDSYYRFVIEGNPDAIPGSNFGSTGFWQESVAPNIPYRINPATMPIKMTYRPGERRFIINRVEWADRTSGTTVSNPNPSFVNGHIQDLGMFQGRLVMLSGNYVIMSRTNYVEDFWIKSVENQADTDPIDISSNSNNISSLRALVPHNKDLVIFSNTGQLVVFGRDRVTPANAALMLTTSFEAELAAKPIAVGRNIIFGTNYGRFTNLREFYTEAGADINDTRPITQHVKELIVGTPIKYVGSSNYDILGIIAEGIRNTVYIYQYIWSDTEKVQSAWSKWEFGFDIAYIFMDKDHIYLVGSESSGFNLYFLTLDVADRENVGYPIYLEGRFDVENMYNGFELPHSSYIDKQLVLIQGQGCPYPGMRLEIERQEGNLIYTKKNMNGGNIIVGYPFKSKYIPTPPLIKDEDGIVISTGRLKLKHYLLSVEDTGFIEAGVQSKYYTAPNLLFEGRVLNDINNVLGQTALYSGTLHIPFREQADLADLVLETTSHLPMTILDIEWTGQYMKRGKRITIGG